MSDAKILVALDYENKNQCLELVKQLDPKLCRLKIGKEMFTWFGPSIVESVQKLGFDVFLDLKFHDIPNTVAKACAAAASLGVWMVNVHASGGKRMMEAAAEALVHSEHKPHLIAVTVLTSMAASELLDLGLEADAEGQVLRLANLAKQSGVDGVVSSAQEVAAIKTLCGSDFLCVTPGIRPAFADKGDQSRVMTPAEALEKGSDYLVIGRPITQAQDPIAALTAIYKEMGI
ncbi:orotidine-5'-phosphate decarboxylase [Agaribacterium haliotis]|uniref:orotidine-5'-phosphate decarboxylase n=1 Tax=Agaribacterium haliotis TaxID=2013869 RepID=UPI000BB531B1|nr:orotidine-5'-phosphate decarboxylase [Agaribacterium haliotis]